jgi:hypothetical protein
MMLGIACDAEEVIATLKQVGGIAKNLRKGLRKQYGADFGIVTIEYRKRQGCTSEFCCWRRS